MNREEMLASLTAKPTPQVESDLEVAEERVIPEAERSDTALELDDWSRRRGWEVVESSERMQKTFGLDDPAKLSADKPIDDHVSDAALATADFHAAAFEPNPQLAQACKNERIHRYMKNLMETPEFQALHNETQLDEFASEVAAAQFAEQWVAYVKTDEPDGEFKKDMHARKACSKALAGATEEISGLRDAQHALGIGGDGGGKGQINGDELAKVFKRVRGNKSLKRICELAGRYRRFAQAQQRKKVLHGRDDVVGVVMDGDIGRLLPHELAQLDDPDLELDVMRRIVERQAMCRDFRGVESKARGPIVVVVDESGSMSGEPLFTAKAVALALAWVARSQNRWCCLVGFSGGTGGSFCVCPPRGATPSYIDFEDQEDGKEEWTRGPESLLLWLEHDYSGGTTCDVPLVEIPKRWVELGCPRGKTDLIAITDAQVDVPGEVLKVFNQWKAAEAVKLITLVINSEPGDMAAVSDKIHRVKSLGMEEEGVGDALSV